MPHPPTPEPYTFHDRSWSSLEELRNWFEWEVPEQFNIAEYVCSRWADDTDRVMLIARDGDGNERTFTFQEFDVLTDRLANYFDAQGIGRGDRIGVNSPQKPATALSYIAAWKLGAVPVPLSTKFGPDALAYRLADSAATACVVDQMNVENYRSIKRDIETLTTTLTVDTVPEDDEVDFWTAVEDAPDEFDTVTTDADSDGMLIYTSGSTGDPKGVLHAHRFLLGHIPLFLTSVCNGALNEDDVFWMPSEWTWIAMFNIIVPGWFYGRPGVSYQSSHFSAREAFEVIDQYEISNMFIPPTALRMMMDVESPTDEFRTDSLRVIASGGESLTGDVFEWASETFPNVNVHEMYGQTEANMLIGHSTALRDVERGTMGFAAPGHEIEILDPDTAEVLDEPGTVGEIGVRYEGNPVCFKSYWDDPERTDTVRKNGFVLTEDLGSRDVDGYYTFVSRKDNVIISSGYRIGPEEVEDALNKHDAVSNTGVVGLEHETRGEVPKAFVELAAGYEPTEEVREELKQFVKNRLAKYEYPREIEFIDEIPKTSTGKIRYFELERRDEDVDNST